MSTEEHPQSHRSSAVDAYLTQPVSDWPPALPSVMVDTLSDALNQRAKAALEDVHQQLLDLTHKVLQALPTNAQRDILDNKGGEFRLAYLLGQLSFAQEFAGTTMHRRPDEAFYAVFEDPSWSGFLQAIADTASPQEVADRLRLALPDVRVKLRTLTELGVIDFKRRMGPAADIAYFLTPAARQMLKQ